jgi:release factor glutamine methyltransferase
MNPKVQKIEPAPPPQPRIWTSLDLIKWTSDFFAKKGIESPRLEAELLLAEVLECPRIHLYVNFEKPVEPERLARYRELVKRRADSREPLQYILGHTQFVDPKLSVTRDVLIPRPETELLALWTVERLKATTGEALRALDLCTGSGCLALFMASKETRAKISAVDLSPAALTMAKKNAETLKLSERVEFYEGDLFAPLPLDGREAYDLIVSNPPYIDPAQKPTLQPEVRDHEPAMALFAEENGLAVVRRIVGEAGTWLKSGGWLGLEFGFGQHEAVKGMAELAGTFAVVEIAADANKIPRFLQAQKR